jgi:hypothetical protein
MIRAALICLVLGVAAGLAGCTGGMPWQSPTRWEKPGVAVEQQTRDEAACRRWASAEAEREYARERYYTEDDVGPGGGLEGRMARYGAERRRAALLDECMRRQGYRPAAEK